MKLHYFKSVPGHLVTRFGDRFRSYIGATVERSKPEEAEGAKVKSRFPQTVANITWSPEPVAIPEAEYGRYRREYQRCIREGSLVQVQAPTESKE